MDPKAIYEEALEAANQASDACKPIGMIVGEAKDLFSNEMIPGTEEFVADGPCGFAWCVIRPARGPLVKWLKANNIGYKHYYGGWAVSMHMGDQSVQRKSAAAGAFASVLRKHGFDAYADARLD